MSGRKTSEFTDKTGRIRSIELIQDILINWGKQHFDPFPWRTTKNSFHALVAEMMLQRTKAEQVEPIYNEFTIRYETPSEAMKAERDCLTSLLKPLGLNWRIEKILECIMALDAQGGHIPVNLDDLMKLPGIGRYVASSYLSFHSGVRASIIDSNVVRLYGRIFELKTNAETRRKKWFLELAETMTPDEFFKDFNYALLDLTRQICKRKPLCHSCPLNKNCVYNIKHIG